MVSRPSIWGRIMALIKDEGVIVLPRKIGLWLVLGGILYLGQQVWSEAAMRATVAGEITNLQRSDIESRQRGDDIRRRVTALEQTGSEINGRLIRVEERLAGAVDILRQIREDQQKNNSRRLEP